LKKDTIQQYNYLSNCIAKRSFYYNGVIRLPGRPGVRPVTLTRSKASSI
jgi:hypothetical protein